MINEAEENAVSDQKFRALADSRNEADARIHSSKKWAEEQGDKLPTADKEAIGDAVTALEDDIKGDDKGKIDEGAASLKALIDKLMQQSVQQDSGQSQSDAPDKPATEDVIDAEFEDVSNDR